MRIRRPEEVIVKNTYTYKLIKRDTKRSMYSQSDGDKIIAYEVFKNKLTKPHPKALSDWKNFDQIERFPSDEEFGKRAWTYKKLSDAEKKYNMIG